MNRIEILKQYIAEDPSDAFSKYALALEFVKIGNEKEAGLLFEELIENHKEYLPAYYHYGKFLERAGNMKLAALTYSSGISLARKMGDNHTRSELQTALDFITD
jgi:tetratricopeptide (TPR) repeat protein